MAVRRRGRGSTGARGGAPSAGGVSAGAGAAPTADLTADASMLGELAALVAEHFARQQHAAIDVHQLRLRRSDARLRLLERRTRELRRDMPRPLKPLRAVEAEHRTRWAHVSCAALREHDGNAEGVGVASSMAPRRRW